MPSMLTGCSEIELALPPIIHFRRGPDANGPRGGPAIISRECTRGRRYCRSKNRPYQHTTLNVPNINPETVDRSDIMLEMTARSLEKVQFSDRDEPNTKPKPLETLQVSTPTLAPCA